MKKRVFGLTLALVMMLALSVPALAAEEPEPTPEPVYRLTKVTNSQGVEYTLTYGQGGYQPTEVLENGASDATASYDEDGRIIAFQDDYSSKTFTYDEDGNRIRRENTSDYGDGPTTIVTEYAYDEDGNCTREEQTNTDGNGSVTTYITEYAFDKDGNCVREDYTCTDSDGAVTTSVTEFLYDEDGNRVRRETTRTDSDGTESTSIAEYTYDEEGRELSVATTSDNEESSKVTYTYSEDGRSTTTAYDDGGTYVEYEAPLLDVFWDNYTEYLSDGTTYQSKLYQIDFWDSTGQSRILCKHRKGANRAEFQRERREAVPFGVILAAKAPHVKIPPAQSGIRSAKYTPNWAWITLQSCRLPVHFWVMSIIAR